MRRMRGGGGGVVRRTEGRGVSCLVLCMYLVGDVLQHCEMQERDATYLMYTCLLQTPLC